MNEYTFPFQKLYLLFNEPDVLEFLPKGLGVNTPLSKVKGKRHRFLKKKKKKEEAQMIQWLAEGHLVIQRNSDRSLTQQTHIQQARELNT